MKEAIKYLESLSDSKQDRQKLFQNSFVLKAIEMAHEEAIPEGLEICEAECKPKGASQILTVFEYRGKKFIVFERLQNKEA